MKKRIVITGASAYGLHNLSDDCMLYALCNALRSETPEIRLTLLARHPSVDLDQTFGVQSIKNLDHENRESSVGRFFWGLNASDPTEHLGQVVKHLSEARLLMISGAPFIDNISIGFMRGLVPYTAVLVTLAKVLGKDIVFNGLHMGRPLVTAAGKELAAFCLQNARLITVRDEETLYFVRDLGIEQSRVHVLADAGFALDAITDAAISSATLTRAGITPGGKFLIGVTFRILYWEWSPAQIETYTAMMAEVCDGLVAMYDCDIVLIPHNTYEIDRQFMDDRPGHRLIAAKARRPERVHVVDARLSITETLSLYPLLHAIFSNRRHSAIWAAIHGVPPVATGEELHVRPPMAQLGLADKYFLPTAALKSQLIVETVAKAIGERQVVLDSMSERVGGLRARALQNATLVTELLDSTDNMEMS